MTTLSEEAVAGQAIALAQPSPQNTGQSSSIPFNVTGHSTMGFPRKRTVWEWCMGKPKIQSNTLIESYAPRTEAEVREQEEHIRSQIPPLALNRVPR
ncbi:hypothetical protein HO173_001730 [Letharia columbiana]|uniref:Uncharacterized protein n=1 Tax=Letharia columbiana TaxID=112416 RepID=A0A8H6L959_9LECA|nr:uncharacterized protein HO173_001730 [Letharia columbiana]KAF6240120.1 hypothetical protein HO173_001730 [Letharia columbiana]